MSRRAVLGGLLLALVAAPLPAQRSLPPAVLHDRIVAILHGQSEGVFPPGDTLVSWYAQGPILYHVVRRHADTLSAAMVRNDPMIGRADVVWREGVQAARVLWYEQDTVLTRLELRVSGDSIDVTGTRTARWPVPALPWAVADYGLEDLAVPLVAGQREGPVTVAIFRPVPFKWDTLVLTSRAVGEGRLHEFRDAKGKREWWLTGPSRALLLLRREGQRFERRPLETTSLEQEYHALLPLLPAITGMEGLAGKDDP